MLRYLYKVLQISIFCEWSHSGSHNFLYNGDNVGEGLGTRLIPLSGIYLEGGEPWDFPP